MWLAVPGKIVGIRQEAPLAAVGPTATVDFQGNSVEVSLAMTPEAAVGDWVLVHAGLAIARLDEAEARQTWEYLQEAGLGQAPGELMAPASAGGGQGGEDTGRG